ncbi:hypothetical protein KPL70_013735 [Citrus sinensis]|nr:hypothetical protein KPL70_013735 [Citrus sinensis]
MINSDGQGKDEYYARYWPLYRMIEKNDWRGVEDFVTNDPDALTAKTVAPGSQTIFHAIVESLVDVESDDATCLLHKLASKVDPQTLARQDEHGRTALYQCAGKGDLRALKVLVKYNPDLTNIWHSGGFLPVHVAAYKGHKDTFQFLQEVTHGVDIYSGSDGATMLSHLIYANLFDVALDLLKLHPTIGRDNIDSQRIVLNSLARKPYAFESGSRLGPARLGIHEFVNEFIMANVLNEDGRNIFDVAVLHRREKVFNLIHHILALFSSISSVLMFLGILISRYEEDDFLLSLPRKLIIGLVTLFFSIASMMVAFGATVHISLSHKWNLVIIPIALVGCVPLTLFALLQFPLLLDMYSSTYGRSIIIDSSWRELASCDLVAKGS